jgi:hypothetical protein
MKASTGRSAEKQVVPEADFTSYHGRPVLKETVWGPDVPRSSWGPGSVTL